MCGSRVAMTPQWCCGYERDVGTAAAAEAGRCAAAFRFIPLHHIPFQSHESLLRTLRITSHSMTPHPDGIRGGRGAARARHDGCRRRERGTRGTVPSHMTSHTIASKQRTRAFANCHVTTVASPDFRRSCARYPRTIATENCRAIVTPPGFRRSCGRSRRRALTTTPTRTPRARPARPRSRRRGTEDGYCLVV